jgi:hypothetical protein
LLLLVLGGRCILMMILVALRVSLVVERLGHLIARLVHVDTHRSFLILTLLVVLELLLHGYIVLNPVVLLVNLLPVDVSVTETPLLLLVLLGWITAATSH